MRVAFVRLPPQWKKRRMTLAIFQWTSASGEARDNANVHVKWAVNHSTSAIVGSFLPSENPLPVVLHADDEPTLRLGFVVQCLSEGADLGIRQSLGRTVGILALCVIVQHNLHQGCSAARLGVLQHLLVAS